MRSRFTYIILFMLLVASCSRKPTDAQQLSELPKIYPDYIGVTIPADIAPLNFAMADEQTTCIDVIVKGAEGGELHSNGEETDFDIDEWHALTEQNRGSKLSVTVCAEQQGQ